LEYHANDQAQMTLAVAKAFVPHTKNGWEFTLDALGRYYERVVTDVAQGHSPPGTPAEVADQVGTYLEFARRLGVRTAELHLALASDAPGSEFSVVPMTPQYLRGLFQSMRSLALKNLHRLRKQMKTLRPDLIPVAQRVIELEPVILQQYRNLVGQRFAAGRIRIHGDCHLGQVLWTGRDFVFLDFEGDSTIPISERRIKRSPLRDVARMLRSFHHATYAGFHEQAERGVISRENLPKFEPWVRHWNRAVSRAYLQAYCQKLQHSGILPGEEDQLHMILVAYLLNQVVDELGDELQLHSDNVRAPLQAIIHLTDEKMLLHITGSGVAKAEGQ
jgi:maltose alpha-D-glucosyltransferase/alpha-amylase